MDSMAKGTGLRVADMPTTGAAATEISAEVHDPAIATIHEHITKEPYTPLQRCLLTLLLYSQ